ncbi:GyrI-like domain-containing protein [Paenibacillus sp. JJ-223]|uniref:AraC family transcriptional regulator n=1 Tax=Paenibacillus sp. JJ-223 TaxID=2905647 RepID=UPI001F4491F4|nr:GyrI-like domain-containing protein [Paenibacillus sp. JJ-223]CAH1216594.1 DNA gyrase inhibitor [Paenibacillus sp. JJ-223]
MSISLETISRTRMAYVRQIGPYGPANKQAMETLKSWAHDQHLLSEASVLFGIPQDDPATTPPEACRYDACIVISDDFVFSGNDPVKEGELAGGDYLVYRIAHTAEAVMHAWTSIPGLVRDHGHAIADGPVMERYKGELLLRHQCELCIPVRKDANLR